MSRLARRAEASLLKYEQIAYRPGYKYQLASNLEHPLRWYDGPRISVPFVALDPGVLHIRRGYAWDGPSGPTIDTRSFMRGSLVHDALYQLMRDGGLAASRYREPADRELRDVCLADGMWSARAWWVYRAVRLAAGPAARGNGDHPLLIAP